MAATNTARKRNPTQADIISTMLAQTVKATQERLRVAPVEDRERLRGSRDALVDFKGRVDRYLAGDLTALYS